MSQEKIKSPIIYKFQEVKVQKLSKKISKAEIYHF